MPKYMIERQYLLPIYHHLAIEAATFAAACAAAMDETKHGWKGAQPDPENARAHTLTRAVEVPAEWADKTAAPAWYLYDAALPALPIPRAHREAPEAPLLDRRHLGTVLAALRYWQRSGEFAGDEIAEIATDGDTLTPLSNTEIDALCEALNTDPRPRPPAQTGDHGSIGRYLDCSTAYLPPAFRAALWNSECPVTAIGEDAYHRWVYVDEHHLDPEWLAENPIPEPVRKIFAHALAHDCHIICFDPDGPDLPSGFEVFGDEDELDPRPFPETSFGDPVAILTASGFAEQQLGGNLVGWARDRVLITFHDGDTPVPGDERDPHWIVGRRTSHGPNPDDDRPLGETLTLTEAIALAAKEATR